MSAIHDVKVEKSLVSVVVLIELPIKWIWNQLLLVYWYTARGQYELSLTAYLTLWAPSHANLVDLSGCLTKQLVVWKNTPTFLAWKWLIDISSYLTHNSWIASSIIETLEITHVLYSFIKLVSYHIFLIWGIVFKVMQYACIFILSVLYHPCHTPLLT